MKSLMMAMIIVGVTFVVGRAFADPSTATELPREPLVTVVPTPTATVAPNPAPDHGEAQRMQFAAGTYGGVYESGTWLLWAGEGQALRIAGDGSVARLTAPDEIDIAVGPDGAVLPASGDYTLTVAGVEQFSIDIR